MNASFAGGEQVPVARPNVIVVLADDLGYSDLGCYGSRFYRTPHLDALAARGVRATQGYAACPVCSPTRASLLTGQYPARLHLTDWLPGRGDLVDQPLARPVFRQALPLEVVTLAEVLRDAGYATGQLGKWHLGGEGFEATQQGFSFSRGGSAAGSPASYFAPYRNARGSIPGLESAPEGEYLTDRLTAEAEQFIETHRDGPFFLYLAHYTVHTPLKAPEELVARYPAWDGVPHGKQENPIYAAMIESLDTGMGRIVAKLKSLGIDEKTLIVFTSDNGGLATLEGPNTPATVNAPLREGKGWLYEGGIRVPWIFTWPGKLPPGTVDDPFYSGDLLPTLAHWCGAKLPETCDGVSLADRLAQGKPLAERSLYWHYPHYANQGGRPGGAIRDGDWKLIEFYEHGRRELYNLARDPGERVNLAEAEPQKVVELAARLAAWRSSVAAQMPTPNPAYHPNRQSPQGIVSLPARHARVHGSMLRYEPLPHKNTLGFWTRADDWASWEFEITQPGEFNLSALIGCGRGSGGARVEWRCAGSSHTWEVTETGGFQTFVPCDVGRLNISEAGRYTFELRALSKPGPAVMDVRQITLTPIDRRQ